MGSLTIPTEADLRLARAVLPVAENLYTRWLKMIGRKPTPEEDEMAMRDFTMNAYYIVKHQLRGVRQAYGGCFICRGRRPGNYRRIFTIHPVVLAKTENRAWMGEMCSVCEASVPQVTPEGDIPQVMLDAILRYIEDHPPGTNPEFIHLGEKP